MQALASGASSILLGESEVVLAGGIESMSRMPYLVDSIDARWGHKMGHFQFVDAMYRDGFQCPLSNLIMGETAEILARQYGITREESDAFALESQHKAEAAQKAGRFDAEIAPVTLTERGKTIQVTADEHPRPGTTIETLRKLPLTFPKVEGHDGIITAGSASGITDGGAALVLASSDFAASRGLTPIATIIGWASAGVDPRIMGIGPVPAIKKLEQRTGLSPGALRSLRAERGLRRPGAGRAPRRADARRPAERERRRDRARPSDRLPPARAWSSRCSTSSCAAARGRDSRRSASAAGWAWRWRLKRTSESSQFTVQSCEHADSSHRRRRDREGRHGRGREGAGARCLTSSAATSMLEPLPWSADHYLKTGETLPPNGYDMLRDDSTRSSSARSATRACPTTATRATSCSAPASSSISTSTTGRCGCSTSGCAR